MKLEHHKIVNGEGVNGVVDGKEVNVGNERMFERLELLTPEYQASVQEWKDTLGGTVVLMGICSIGTWVCWEQNRSRKPLEL